MLPVHCVLCRPILDPIPLHTPVSHANTWMRWGELDPRRDGRVGAGYFTDGSDQGWLRRKAFRSVYYMLRRIGDTE